VRLHDEPSAASAGEFGGRLARFGDGSDVVRSFHNVRWHTDRGPRTGQACRVAREFLVGTAKAQRSAAAADEPLFGLADSAQGVRAVRPAAQALRVLVVDNPTLHALAATLLQSPGDALSATSEKAGTFCADERAFDIVLLAVSSSTLAAMVLAAHLRAIERQKPDPRRAAIIACTVRSDQYHDCLVPGSGLSDALDSPWTPATLHACFDRWRGVRFLPSLDEAATRIY
jgi:CheY-like chemotaxis protein